MDSSQRVAEYFALVGLNDLKRPDADVETLEPITDVCVIFKSSGEEPPQGYECIEFTQSKLPANMNFGAIRSPECYLCYRRGRDKPPLTDIGVLYEGKQRLMPGCGIVHKTPSGLVANVNNAGNMRIFITYRRASPQFAHSSLAVIEICVIITSKGEKPPHAFCLIDKNLNQGLVGSDVYLCYRKSLARTNSLSYHGEIISRFPPTDYDEFPLPDSVPLFCLPLGAVVECWPEKAQPPLPIFSTFALTGMTGEKIYGAGLTFFEELPTKLFTDEVYDLLELQKKNYQDEKLVAHSNKCICLLSHFPFFDAFRRFLLSLYRISVSGNQTIPIERYVSHFVTNVPFPTPQRPIVLVQMTHEEFEIAEPWHGPLPLNGASYSALLRSLGPENAVLLLHCVLTEHKILIHSLRPALLTSVGEAITSLIFPFSWQCPYIPLCPLALADMLSAPVPFIYGIDSRFFDRSSPPEDVTCIDLDTNVITLAVEPKDPKAATWKSLPKVANMFKGNHEIPSKPGKILKDKLDDLFYQLYKVSSDDSSDRAVDMAPLDLDVMTLSKKRETIEMSIREAFLRFHATILKGYRQFLLPITDKPNAGSYDVTSLFDLQGFLKSRQREHQKFFALLTKTQLFHHFIEQRSFSSSNDSLLAFFDDSTERCESTKPLLQLDHSGLSQRTVVVTPPDASGLQPGVVYSYDTFPKLREELFVTSHQPSQLLKVKNITTPPKSPVVGRTRQERQQSSLSAKKQANSPTLWARLLLGHCYSIWYIHLPSYVKGSGNKGKVLNYAFEVLKKIEENKAQLSDEVCFRVLMQLSGQFSHPAIAVKVLFEMKKQGLAPNAITWGHYHKAVLEGKWNQNTASGKQLWRKVKNVLLAVRAFQTHSRKTRDLISFSVGSSDNVSTLSATLERTKGLNDTASLGTASDGGYSSLLSTEDLSRQQPVAPPALIDFPAEYPDVDKRADSSQGFRPSSGHRRQRSSTETSEAESEPETSRDADHLLGGAPIAIPKPRRANLVRRLSETSISSTLSESPGNSHVIICHDGSWHDTYEYTTNSLDLFEETEPRFPFKLRSDIAMEAIICSGQPCTSCGRMLYDEEIMGNWNADDSNWKTKCPFCNASIVPQLQIRIKDYRGLQSKVCSTSSLSSETSSVGYSTSSAIDISRDDISASNPALFSAPSSREDTTFFSPPSAGNSLFPFSPPTSKPVPIVGKRFSRDIALSSSAPSSASSSPLPNHRNSPRPAFYRVRNSNSTSSCSMFVGSPEEKPAIYVSYLSPLVLRKELESLLENDGDLVLQQKEIVTQRPIIFWNMVWYFRRLNLTSHLPELILQSFSDKYEDGGSRAVRVVLSTSWDNDRQQEGGMVPMYMLWNVPADQQDALVDKGWTSRNVLKTVAAHIQENDVYTPLNILLDERRRQQAINPAIHWSLYRELLFLSLTACGSENIDIDAFDREYKIACKQLIAENMGDRLKPDDKPPSSKAVWCRRAFQEPTLQPRVPNLALL